MSKKLWLSVLIAFLVLMGTSIAVFTQSGRQTITISGAWALYPMMVEWAEEYGKQHPSIKIELSAGGAGKGMTDVLSGLVDIGMVSRKIYDEEINQGAFWISVVKDAVVPTMNKDNPIAKEILSKGISRTTFTNIFIHKNITSWNQIISESENSNEIHVYVRSDSCGAAETWAEFLGKRQENLHGIGVYGDPGLADAVKNDRIGIGFNNINYAYDTDTGEPVQGILVIPIDLDENGNLEDSEDFFSNKAEILVAISSGAYPSPPTRDLNLVGNGEFVGASRDFVEWILTDGQEFTSRAGYVQLSEQRRLEELAKLDHNHSQINP